MLKVHLCDGSTLTFNLSEAQEAQRLAELQRDPKFCAQMTAVTIVREGVAYTAKLPGGRRSVDASDSERGEKVSLFAGDLAVTMMVTKRQRGVSVTAERVRPVWRPGGDSGGPPVRDGE